MDLDQLNRDHVLRMEAFLSKLSAAMVGPDTGYLGHASLSQCVDNMR